MVRIRFERTVLAADRITVIGQEIERQFQLFLEPKMAFHSVCTDAERNGIGTGIAGNGLAHGGQLVRSARGEILGIKNQQNILVTAKMRQRDGAA